MPLEIIGEWKRGAFWPGDAVQLEQCEQALRSGKPIRAEFSFPRNPKQHRLLFALLNLIAQNSETYNTPEKALIVLKIATGHIDPVIMPEGKLHWNPKSISYSAMSQAEFGPWFDDALHYACTRMLPGTMPSAVCEQLFEMTGIRVEPEGIAA